MSSRSFASSNVGTKTKQFGKGNRIIPADRAQKYYPAEEVSSKKKARKTIRPTHYRDSLQPGTILILLAGRFRGKRVILLKNLTNGVILVTGPFKANGVPLRRVNARYVIATSHKVELTGVDSKVIEEVSADGYFTKGKAEAKDARRKGEEAFFSQGTKPEKKAVDSKRAEHQKAVDKALLANIKKEPYLLSYLHSSFSLRNGDKPHMMKF